MDKEKKYKEALLLIKYKIENTIGISPLLYKINKIIEEALDEPRSNNR